MSDRAKRGERVFILTSRTKQPSHKNINNFFHLQKTAKTILSVGASSLLVSRENDLTDHPPHYSWKLEMFPSQGDGLVPANPHSSLNSPWCGLMGVWDGASPQPTEVEPTALTSPRPSMAPRARQTQAAAIPRRETSTLSSSYYLQHKITDVRGQPISQTDCLQIFF